MTNSRRSSATGLALALGLAAIALQSCFLSPYGYLTEVDTRTRSPKSEDCGGCHVEIYREFKASRHATSFVDPQFMDATAGHAFTNCLGCHAPETIYSEGEPKLRDAFREEGVNCVACHFDKDVLAGPAPRSALMDPHPVAAERQMYRSAELCGKCHVGTFKEWQEANAAATSSVKTCQECHMKAAKRTLTQATDTFSKVLVSFEDEFAGRSHTFEVDAIAGIEDAFEVTAAVESDGAAENPERKVVAIRLTSKVPHLVPTGDFGFRRVTMQFEASNAAGDVVATHSEDLFKEMKNVVSSSKPREFHLECPVAATQLRIVLSTGKREGARVVVFERRLSL